MRRPREDLEARERALDALALSRREAIPLSRASRAVRTTPRTVLRYAGPGFRREGRRWVARPFDRIPRELTVLTGSGPELVVTRDSRTASLLARHAIAVQRYRDAGDDTELRRLRGRSVRVGGRRYLLVTDVATLDWLIAGAELSYELYRR